MKKVFKNLSKYEIHEDGSIWSIKREKFLKSLTEKKGHQRIMLIDDSGNRVRFLVHRLVATAFIPNPKKHPFVCHIDSNPKNNHYTNLRWDDASGNMQDRLARGLYKDQKGSSNNASKLTEGQVVEIRKLLRKYSPYKIAKLGLFKGVSIGTFGDIKSRRSWKHLK